MSQSFTEMLLFQVKPDKTEAFEALVQTLKVQQANQTGCVGIRYFKRFFDERRVDELAFDGVEPGESPRALSKVVKCVKYYAYWEFDTIEHCGKANGWLFETHLKEISKLLIMPFEINSGYSI